MKCVFTCKEVLLCIDEVVSGFVDLNLTLPGLRHIPNTWVTGYHVELNRKTDQLKLLLYTYAYACKRMLSCCTYSQHLSLQQGPVLHAAGGVHMQ